MRVTVQRSVGVVSLMAMMALGVGNASAAAPVPTKNKASARAAHGKQAVALHLPDMAFNLRVPRLDSLQSLSGLGAALAPLKGLELGHCGLSGAPTQRPAASPGVGNEGN